jgi:hypothetical protein
MSLAFLALTIHQRCYMVLMFCREFVAAWVFGILKRSWKPVGPVRSRAQLLDEGRICVKIRPFGPAKK